MVGYALIKIKLGQKRLYGRGLHGGCANSTPTKNINIPVIMPV